MQFLQFPRIIDPFNKEWKKDDGDKLTIFIVKKPPLALPPPK